MDSVLPILALIWGFLAGTVLFAMVGRWIYTIIATVQSYRGNDARWLMMRDLLTSGILHSGPWSLAVAAYLSYYLLSQPHAEWWLWFFTGVCLAPVLVIAAWLRSTRRRKSDVEHVSLTPERLALQRRRTVWGTTLFIGGVTAAIMIGGMWGAVRAPGFIVFVVAVCMAGGYVVALFMWEWRKSLLQGEENERRRKESGK